YLNKEGTTTLHKTSTTNIDNTTTRIQNNTITINQHGTITSIQDSTITKNLTSLHEDEIQLAKQEFLTEHINEVNVIQNSINQLNFTNPMSAQ
ncbi:16562_t:CDS:1, partial [Dentiscutata heterogama]